MATPKSKEALALGIDSIVFPIVKKPLYDHTSEQTALVRPDPASTKEIRYWLEHDKRGWRFCTEVTDSAKPRWSTVEKSAYAKLAGAMYFTQYDYKPDVRWAGVGPDCTPEYIRDFVENFPGADFSVLEPYVREKMLVHRGSERAPWLAILQWMHK